MLRGNTNWLVQDTLDSTGGHISSASGSNCPAQAKAANSQRFKLNNWLYSDNGWKEGEIVVKCKQHEE